MISATGLIVPSTLEMDDEGDELCPLGEQRIERVELQQAVVGDGDVPQHRARALGKLLPGHEVRVVLHLGEQDFVAPLDIGIAPTPRHGVDAGRRAIREDALFGRGRVDEPTNLFPRLIEQFVRFLGKLVDAAMHVGIVLFVATGNRPDHLPRMLRAGGVVEIDERHARTDLAGEDGKIRSIDRGVQR